MSLFNAVAHIPISLDIDESRMYRLLEGLGDIGITMQKSECIPSSKARQRVVSPWLFN
ncbi:hypothetical protein [Limnohabitans sp. T6-5]|uniref:hypothetical protein n=1 Tax=Limnohabitans sp. T6-5 TaxID=1100724 RepID=UPI001304847C|nr:hypothetical protein [Limnohabitans sp. T6-5]